MESSETTAHLSCTEELLQEVVDAKEKYLSSLKKKDVFQVMQSACQKTISS